MAPAKKKAQQTLSLGEFLTDEKYGSWADEMEDMPAPSARTGYGNRDRDGGDRYGSSFGGYGDRGSDRYGAREDLPLPTKPPYTAHVGNLPFEVTEGEISDFFKDCEVSNVRIVMDRLEGKPKGFGYVEFGSLEGLKAALDLSGTQFSGRNIRVSVAEPPKERPDDRAFGSWERKGPLPDLPGQQRRTSDRGFGAGRGGFDSDRFSDAGSDRFDRRSNFGDGDGKSRDFSNWERKGPLAPLAPSATPAGRGRGRGADEERRQSPAWGEGRSQDGGSRPPRKEFERTPTAAELDNEWRKPKPESEGKESSSRERSIPTSPVQPSVRPKLNLQKRSEAAAESAAATPGDSKASPFGAARPIDTAAREKEVVAKRELAIREKREQDEKARAEKKEQEEKSKAERKAAKASATPSEDGEEGKPAQKFEILRKLPDTDEDAKSTGGDAPAENGSATQERKTSVSREGKQPPRRSEGSWRRGSDQKKPQQPREPRERQQSQQQQQQPPPAQDTESPAQTPTKGPDEDGWSTVSKPQKRAKGGPARNAQ